MGIQFGFVGATLGPNTFTGAQTVTMAASAGVSGGSGLILSQSFTGTSASGVGSNANLINVSSNDSVQAGGAFMTAFAAQMNFGGANTVGGQIGVNGSVTQTAATSATNTNRNYVGGNFTAYANSDDGGTGVTASLAKGAYFGLGANVVTNALAIKLLNVSAAEFNTTLNANSTVYYKSLIQLSGNNTDAAMGTGFNVMASFSNQGNVALWDDGILFSNANGFFPIRAAGTLFRTLAGSFTNGIDISSSTISGTAFKSPSFNVDGTGNLTALNFNTGGNIQLGATATLYATGASQITFLSNGTLKFQNAANTSGIVLDFSTNAGKFRNLANGADAPITGSTISVSTNIAYIATNQVSGAAAAAGTLTNAPSAGNPNFWLPVSINGTTRYLPAW